MKFITVEKGAGAALAEFGETVRTARGYRTLIALPPGKSSTRIANQRIDQVIRYLELKGIHAWSDGGANYGDQVNADFYPSEGYTWE